MGKHYLISKTTQKYTDYASNVIKLSKSTPYTVDEVVIGKNGKPCKKITTFKDSKGNLIERIFNYEGEPLRNRIYTHNENTIGEDEIVSSTTIKSYYLKRNHIDIYRKIINANKPEIISKSLQGKIVKGTKISKK